MKQIRKNVFETNSSSTHTLVYIAHVKSGVTDSFYTGHDDGIVTVHFGNYGWEGPTRKSPEEKLSYLMTFLASKDCFWGTSYHTGEKDNDGYYIYHNITTTKEWESAVERFKSIPEVKKILDGIVERQPSVKGFKFVWWSEDLWEYEFQDHRDLEDPYWKTYNKWCTDSPHDHRGTEHRVGFGTIDHQTADCSLDYVLNGMDPVDFIFSAKAMIVIDHDNH